jgi:flagellar protein FliS
MRQTDAWKSYRQVATQTASPGQLVLMLYDGAIRFLQRALTGFGIDDPAECNSTINNNVLKTQAILGELDSSLNLEAGGELARHLRQVYLYLDWRLTESNTRKEAEGIQEAIGKLTLLRDAWAQMLAGQTVAQPMAEVGELATA